MVQLDIRDASRCVTSMPVKTTAAPPVAQKLRSTMQQNYCYDVVIFVVLTILAKNCKGHAIFWEPPSRASLGKHNLNFCKVPINNDHMSVYCGGVNVQHLVNKGKCGICGDAFNAEDQPHKYPGKYATGIIGRSYFVPGQLIDVIIDVVANHRGFFAFRLCPNNNPVKDPEPSCFEQYPLKFANGQNFYFLDPALKIGTRIELKLKLPDALECWQCIIQWSYVAGNNWGVGAQNADFITEDCLNKPGKLGCGPQETFRGCADVCIGPRCPTEVCTVARPFDDSTNITPTHTTPAPSTPEYGPPTPDAPISPTPDENASTPDENAPTTETVLTAPTPYITPTMTHAPTTSSVAEETTTPSHSHVHHIPPIYLQICNVATIRPTFYSTVAQDYCTETCEGKPMDVCNLYLCYCQTNWITTKDQWEWK